ncbi:MAG: hypothetical protein LBV74_22400 [Tannerella sp.]|jgi:hypothetical protein|nr:hypothetical protein [Tannerella sp.]
MRQFGFFIGAFLVFFFQVDFALAKISYVKAGAAGDGSSWVNASGDLQAVINESSDGDEIWVAAGVYVPNRQINNPGVITSGHRNNAFVVSKNIRIYGGFAGYETGISQRSITENTTVLSGETGHGNLYHVLVFVNGCDALLDGFTIVGGNADGHESILMNGKEFRQDVGGGIFIMRSSPRLNHVIIKENVAVYGGGMYSYHSFPVLTNVVITHNSAGQGGWIYHYYSFPVMANMTVSRNTGGGIFNAVSKPDISNSVVWGNIAYDIHNNIFSRTNCSYSLVQYETADSDFIMRKDDAHEDNAGLFLYVAPDGNDANTGTKDLPLATIAGARDKIRNIKATGLPDGGIIVYFRGGTYNVTETTNLTEEDSGTASSPIVYKAYPGETPLFTGGCYIKGNQFGTVTDVVMLERLSPEVRDKVLCYDLFANGFNFNDLDYSKDFWKEDNLKEHVREEFFDNNYFVRRMQVFMDDEALYLARYPNKKAGIFTENPYNTFLSVTEIYGGRSVPGFEGEEAWDGKNPVFRIDEPRMKNWKSHDDIIVFGMMGAHYENERNLVKEINTQAMTVELQSMPTYGLFDEARVAFENVFEELDRPGEYYIDKNTGVLYLYPIKEMKDATVKVSVFDENFMIDVREASYLTFSGLTFELTKGSVFFIRGGQNCTVENCEMKNFAIWGVRLGDNALTTGNYAEAMTKNEFDASLNLIPASDNGYNHKITGCNFLNTGHHACRIASGNVGTREKGNMVFENNVIKYSGLIGSTYRSGLELQGAGITVKNNSFFYCLGQAINGNIIDTEIIYNEFCDSPCDMAEDTGTLYLNYLNTNDGVKIRYNFFHDVTNADNRFGYYFGHALRAVVGYDNNAPFRDFSYNVVYNYPSAGQISIVAPWTCFNNIFVDCDVVLPYYGEFFDSYKGKTAMDLLTEQSQSTIAAFYTSGLYKTPLWKETYPELYEYYEYMANGKADLQQPMDMIYNNLIVNINKSFHDRNSSLDELQLPAQVSVDPKYGKINNNTYLFHNPGFPGVVNRNLQLSQEVTRRYGLQWIDMSKIGSPKAKRNNIVLPVTSMLVHNDSELKEALDDGSIDEIIFANDITVNRSDLVICPRRAKSDLVIDGNGYTLKEFMVSGYDNTKPIRLESKGTICSITVRSLNIQGHNGAGNVYISATESVGLVYRNVTYKGPKLAENVYGSILVDNSNIHISFPEGGAYMGEAVKANRICFRDHVNIRKDYDSDGTMEAVLKLTGPDPSLIIETFPRQTEVAVEYSGLEIGEERYIGGGGAIDADNPFDFIVETNAAFRYNGFYEYLSGAKPKHIVENWNSTIGVIIYEDAQRGATDKILSVDGDVTIGMTSSIDIDVHAPSQCLLEVGGNLHIRPGGNMWLGGYKYDPTIPGIEASKYPVLLMKGGPNSNILFDRPAELIIKSQNTQQEWMRSIGFVSDGTIKFIAHQLSFAERMSESETTYQAEDNGLIIVEAVVKGGIDGVTQSLTYQTENGVLINGGDLTRESIDLKNITHFHLVSEREQLQLESGEYENRNEIIYEPDKYPSASGNIDRNVDPLFQNISAANFRLKPESPLIDAGDNQKYFEVAGLIQDKGSVTDLIYNVNSSDLMQKDETDIAGNVRIIGDFIDIGAYEYDPSETGNAPFTELTGNIVIWSQQGKLYIHAEKPERINIYTLSGILIRTLNLQENETATISLDMGIYIVVPSGGKARKTVI